MFVSQTEVSLDLNEFVIAKEEQYKIQSYVESGIQSPATNNGMKLEIEKILRAAGKETKVTDEEVEQFSELISNYKGVKEHCSDFKTRIYPKSVQMADNLSFYGSNTCLVYKDILDTAKNWLDGITPADQAKAEINDFAGTLKITAESYARKVDEVKGDFVQFLLDTQSDETGLKGTKNLYDTRFNLSEGEIKTLQDGINSINAKIQMLQEEYNKAVTITSTTPLYYLACPLLFIYISVPVAVVAGIYGKQATDLLSQIEGERQKLAAQTETLQKRVALKAILEAGNNGLQGLLKKLEDALPVLDKIKGLWKALATQATEIPQVIETNVLNGSLVEIDTAYYDLIDRWKILSSAAGQYRDTAYIKIEYVDLEEIKKNPEKYMDIDPSQINWNPK
jgi:Bacillus haemolytic enterotoxin (HBL)